MESRPTQSFFENENIPSSEFWESVRNDIEFDDDGCIVFDDVVLSKPYAKEIEVLRSQWSGSDKKVVLDIGIFMCLYVNPKTQEYWIKESIMKMGNGTEPKRTYYKGRLKTSSINNNSVAFSPDGNTIASGCGDGTIHLWNANNGTHLRTIAVHTGRVWSIAFSPDGNTIAGGGSNFTIGLWHASDGTHLRTLTGHTERIWSVTFSPDGSTIASGSMDETIRLWNASDGTHLRTLTGHTSNVYSVAFSPDGSTIASGSSDSTVRLWNTNDGTHLHTLTGHTHNVFSVAFSPDGSTIASGSEDGTIRLWNVNDGTHIRTITTGHVNGIWSVPFSPDGSAIASCDLHGNICLWNASDGTHIHTLSGNIQETSSFKFTMKRLGVRLGLRLGHTNWVNSLAFSPDGSALASAGDIDPVHMWDVRKWC